VIDLVDAFAAGDVAGALAQTAELLNQGVSQDQLVELLIERLRHLMLIAACGEDTALLELSDDARAGAIEQAKKFDAAALTYMIALCDNVLQASRGSSTPRALLDTAVVRLALAEKMADVTSLLTGQAPTPAPKKKRADEEPAQPFVSASPAADRAPVPAERPPETVAPAEIEIDIDDPQAVWRELCRRVGDRPGREWMSDLALRRVTGNEAVLTPLPGQRHVAAFATPDRLAPAAEEMSKLIGRRMRLRVEVAAEGHASSASADGGARDDAESRRRALELPLVRHVLETFPDAAVIGIHNENGSDVNGDEHAGRA
jgi:DNA polymerase-3 subunit gamma/tau